MTSLTRGPLPARVYWFRRLLVLGVAVALVAGIGWLLGRGSDATETPAQASQVAAEGTDAEAAESAAAGAGQQQEKAGMKAGEKGKKAGRKGKKAKPVLAEPDGPCANEDVAVLPRVEDAVAGRDVPITLQLRTLVSAACTWEVSPQELTLKIRSGQDDIWSSRECPAVIPTRGVVLRNNATTEVAVTWNSRRSDEDCSRRTDWARPGWYHVSAAALAGEPEEVQFELATPTAPVITRTATAEPEPSPQKTKKKRGQDADS